MGTTQSQHEDTAKSSHRTKPRSKVSKRNASHDGLENTNYNLQVDQIDRKQAREDLMAYLEIVGENADDLPLTWRDDPELGRTISSLTSKQYATKSDAFIPCDVRVIGGSCLKYSSTKAALPDKENFFLGERAQEPGLSQGGCVANALLKVIYDFETNDAVAGSSGDVGGGGVDDYLTTDNLFDDDDDDDDGAFNDDDDESFGALEFGGMNSGATLSWAELLRGMKDEMEALGYDQVPTLSTSRRFDLDAPVYLLPEAFDHGQNKKFSLLVGCNYGGETGDLSKSHDDIHMVKDYIVNVFNFPEDSNYMAVLLDDGKHKKPTYSNILQAMKFIALRSRPGDAVFIQFSGHGGRVLDFDTSAVDCYDEVIVPSDFKEKGFISDKAIFKSLLVPMAEDVTVTMIFDSCDTGVMVDLPYAWGTKNDDSGSEAKLTLNENFSFVRFLKVVRQLYENDNGENDDSDGSVVTMTMMDQLMGDDDSLENGIGKKIDLGATAEVIASKVGNTLKLMADEAAFTGKTAVEMYNVFMEMSEDRHKGGKSVRYDRRDESEESDDASSYSESSLESDAVSSLDSEDSYAKKVKGRYSGKRRSSNRNGKR